MLLHFLIKICLGNCLVIVTGGPFSLVKSLAFISEFFVYCFHKITCLIFFHKIIEKPMDFSTIKRKMDAKDGFGYKNVRDIYSDVRLIFKNAMRYNDEKHDVHVMAKTLLEKFEKKWLQLLPKVDQAVICFFPKYFPFFWINETFLYVILEVAHIKIVK